MRRALILLLPLAMIALPTFAQPRAPQPACTTVSACIENLRADARAHNQVGEPTRAALASLGDAAVDALVSLLTDPDPYVEESAALALTAFRHIDTRHLSALVQAWRHGEPVNAMRRGSGWMPRPIAATGTDEALHLLWDDFLRDPDQSSNSQTFSALAMFGDRARPLILARYAACRQSIDGAPCAGLAALMGGWGQPRPQWSIEALVDLADNAADNGVREGAERQLVQLSHPAGLAPTQRRLAALPPEAALRQDWAVRDLIGGIASYGIAARGSAGVIARYLEPRFSEDLRAEAALALGRIGDPGAARALIAIAPDYEGDWVLAYNGVESLGRLRAIEARPLLARLAETYWHPGVRNNAQRAVDAIDHPDAPFAGEPYATRTDEQGNAYLYFGHLRFAGDDAGGLCESFADDVALASDPVGLARWPRHGAAEISFQAVRAADAAEARRNISRRTMPGGITMLLPTRDGLLVGVNGGEFGGGLAFLDENDQVRTLIAEPVSGAWRMGGRLYVLAGLAHLIMDEGHLYVVDPERLRVERRIRLPASPTHLLLSDGHIAIVDTAAGQVAIREDGRLVDVNSVHGCDED